MIQSKQVLEWQAQARAEGYMQGRAEALLEVLQERVGTLPLAVIEQVRGMRNDSVLKQWAKLATRATSLDQFLHDSGSATNGA